AFLRHVVDAQGYLVVAAQRDRAGVHYLQVALDHVLVGEAFVACRRRVLGGIGGVHAVDLGRLQQQVGADLDRAQRRGGIGREERIAGTGREDRDAPLFEVTDRTAADEVLAHL